MSTPAYLTYATIALAKTIEVAAHFLGVHSELLDISMEVAIMAAYIELARAH